MASTQDHFNRKAVLSQPVILFEEPGIGEARAPKIVGRLLTIRQACERFPGLHRKMLYRLVEIGRVDAVQLRPNGRIYYSEVQLRRWYNDLKPAGGPDDLGNRFRPAYISRYRNRADLADAA